MMAYPPDPLEYEIELYLNSAWRDVTTDVLGSNGITIRRGRPDQSANPSPSSCSFVLNNSSGDYSPRWPLGQWYGSIGRNTPIRAAVLVAYDTFTRTVSSGWGSATTGAPWTSGGTGGSVLASDHNVGSSVGTQSVPAVSAYRYDYLATITQACVDVRADMTLSFTNVTGGDVYPCGIMLRGQSTSSYYHVRVGITTAEAVTVGIFDAAGATISAAVTVAGITHSSSQTLRVRAQAEGHTLRAKVWVATGSEPFDWHITVHDESLPSAGFVGIRSGLSAGNSNTLPVVVSVDNVRVKVPLYSGEISDMPAGWDISGNFVTANVVSGGPLRRLGQARALQSTLRRGYLRDLAYPPIAYWPCEDAVGSNYLAAAIGNQQMFFTSGLPTLAALAPFDSSDPLPALNFSAWTALVPTYTGGRCQVRFLVSIPSGGLGLGLRRLMVIALGGGTISEFSIFVDGVAGDVWVIVYDRTGTFIYNSGPVDGTVGVPMQVAFEWEQTAPGTVNVNLLTLVPGASAVSYIGASGANMPGTQTVGAATKIVIDPDVLMPETVAIGHISFHTSSQTLLNLSSQINAWKGETALARVIRLGNEERYPVSYIGTPSEAMPMGQQDSITLTKLIYECAAADLGELYEARGETGLVYRSRTSLYNQSAAITLDYGDGQLSESLVSVDDDQYLRNDVTVSRAGGSSGRYELASGRLSVLPPEDGGSGRYDAAVTVNVYDDTQLQNIAGWLVNLGTVDEARYPVINLDLANSHLVGAGFQDAVLDLEIGDRLVITNPKPGQTADSITQIIVGSEIVMRRFEFRVKLNCVPESPYQVGVIDDAVKRLDSDHTTLAADITSSATSFTAAISAGALWTTVAGDLPFDIKVGGEVMTVGAVSGTSSPQTFSSVTRSVNGVVKAQTAGTAVHVAYPFIIPL